MAGRKKRTADYCLPLELIRPLYRGEKGQSLFLIRTKDDSTPLTRGKAIFYLLYKALQGFIPAYAGKSSPHLACRMQQVDSSPHTRGKGLKDTISASDNGFIPAYAGKSYLHPRLTGKKRIHPRIRGEKPERGAEYNFMTDSSPHTRGKAAALLVSVICRRFIPAYAGKRC